MLNKLNLNGSATKTVTLYHGSKSGLCGKPCPTSRDTCDFGRAFYLGTLREQAFSIALTGKNPSFYVCELDLAGLRVERLHGIPWMLYVGYNRNVMPDYAGSTLFQSFGKLHESADVVVGSIADDSIYPAFEDFTRGTLTDKGLEAALSKMQLGEQYALLSDSACERVVCNKVTLNQVELSALQQIKRQREQDSHSVIRGLYRLYRNVGATVFDFEDWGLFNETYESLRARFM